MSNAFCPLSSIVTGSSCSNLVFLSILGQLWKTWGTILNSMVHLIRNSMILHDVAREQQEEASVDVRTATCYYVMILISGMTQSHQSLVSRPFWTVHGEGRGLSILATLRDLEWTVGEGSVYAGFAGFRIRYFSL